MDQPNDPARPGDLRTAVDEVMQALEPSLEFEGPDPAKHRSAWMTALDQPLPGQGREPRRLSPN